MKEVPPKLNGMVAVMYQDVVIELKISVHSTVESSGRSNCGEDAAQIHLRISHVRWIRRGPQQSVLCGKRVPRVGISLPARNAEPAEAKLVQNVLRKRMRLSDG